MTGNNSAVMKNLPSYVIEKVKAYDEKSDLSRLTGIDDGEDDFVLEFTTKRSARRGLQANPDFGYGTDNRYGIRLTAMKPFSPRSGRQWLCFGSGALKTPISSRI